METANDLFTRLLYGYRVLKLTLALCAGIVFLVLLLSAGGSIAELLLICVAAFFYILLPGRFWCRSLRLDDYLPCFAFPLNLLFGVGSLAVFLCIGIRLDLHWLVRLAPPVCGIGSFVIFRKKKNESFLSQNSPSCFLNRALSGAKPLLLLLIAALIFVYGWCGVVKYTHAAIAGTILPNHDFLWNVGNAESFLIQFPPEDLRFYDVRLTYHYLTEMVTAALSLITGIPCYDILAFYQQPLVLCALVGCLYAFGCYFFQNAAGEPHQAKALLFVFAPFLFACASLWAILPNGLSVFWTTNIAHLVTNINSQATLIIFLCIFSALFIQAARLRFKIGVIPFATTVASFILLCFAKGPAAAIVACAVVLTVLFLLFRRQASWRGALMAFCIGGIFLIIYLTMFSSGPTTSVVFSLSGTLEKGLFGGWLLHLKETAPTQYRVWRIILIPVQAVLMLPAAMPLVLVGVAKDLRRLFTLPAEILFANACAAGGTIAYFLYDHTAMSQIYFFLLAVFFLDLLAIRQLDNLSRWRQALSGRFARLRTVLRRTWIILLAALAAVGLLTAIFTYVNLCGSGLRQLLRNYGITETYPYPCTLTADDEAAALWLRENTDADICMFATNRIHTGARREGISNIYSALSARQGFMEGYQYAVTNMGVSAAVLNERIAVNDTLFNAATDADTIRALCGQYGITHLLYSRQMDGDESQLTVFPCVYSGPDVRVYEIYPGK